MSEEITKQQNELAKLIERHWVRTVFMKLLFRLYFYSLLECDGAKLRSLQAFLMYRRSRGEGGMAGTGALYIRSCRLPNCIRYLPVTAQVIKASPNVPYLGFKLEFTPSQILEVLNDSEIRLIRKKMLSELCLSARWSHLY